MTIAKQVSLHQYIRINKPTHSWFVISASQVIQTRLFVKHIPSIPKRLHRPQCPCHCATFSSRLPPRVIEVPHNFIAVRIHDPDNVPLQVLHIRIAGPVPADHRRTVTCIVPEMQLVAALDHVYDVLAVQNILGHNAIDGLLHTQAFGVLRKFGDQTAVDLTHGCQLTTVLPLRARCVRETRGARALPL